jgi:hypothetical protein
LLTLICKDPKMCGVGGPFSVIVVLIPMMI